VSDGRTSHEGVEYALTWQALESLAATVSGTHARHRYEFSRAIEGGETITAGNDIDNRPAQPAAGRAQFLAGAGRGDRGRVARVGDYFIDAANGPPLHWPRIAELRVRWNSYPNGRWRCASTTRLDRAYADRADFAFGTYRYFPDDRVRCSRS